VKVIFAYRADAQALKQVAQGLIVQVRQGRLNESTASAKGSHELVSPCRVGYIASAAACCKQLDAGPIHALAKQDLCPSLPSRDASHQPAWTCADNHYVKYVRTYVQWHGSNFLLRRAAKAA
jgi:hypothetical protein